MASSTARASSRNARTLAPTPPVYKVRKTPWQSQALLMRGAHREDGKVLGVIVQPDGPVLALETDNPGGTLADIFGSHAHAIVCEHPTSLSHAVEAAETYLDRWLAHSLGEHERCSCTEIGHDQAKNQDKEASEARRAPKGKGTQQSARTTRSG